MAVEEQRLRIVLVCLCTERRNKSDSDKRQTAAKYSYIKYTATYGQAKIHSLMQTKDKTDIRQ